MKKLLTLVLLSASVFALAANLLKNPDFSAKNGRTWNLRQGVCSVKNNTLQITLKNKQTYHLFSEKIVLDQQERAPIYFGAEYKGFCNTKSWEHAIILTELTYQDGTKEGWPKVLLGIPKKADNWQKLEKTVKLPKPVKSFKFLILLKDETSAQFRNPYVRVDAKIAPAQAVIVLPAAPLNAEKFAAEELADHAEKMTGKRPVIVSEDQKLDKNTIVIYLGRTKKAAANGFDFARFNNEQYQISSVDGGLIIGGANFNGTLYGVYHYLENVCGVRWYTLTETKLPKIKELPVRDIYLSGKPAFTYRAIYAEGHDYDGRFMMRNRQNSNFSGWKFSIFDGIPFIGPSVHTHCVWVKPSKYFKKNPEFFAQMPNGKRSGVNLCMMSKGARKAMIHEVREALRKRYAEKDKKPLAPIQIVNISHMDTTKSYCVCKDCSAFAKKHQALSASDIDFINEVATALKDEFPNVIFQTLAYTYTEKPPVGIKAADNVCVQMCDTTSNVAVPVDHPDNVFFFDCLTGWTKIAKNVIVWDYWITFNFGIMGLGNELPCATLPNIAADLRTFRKLGIPMFFTEMEYNTGTSDVYDFKRYLALKLVENPHIDEKKAAAEFVDDFYGPAGKLFLEYRTKLAEVQKKWHPFIPWDAQYGRFTYLNIEFLKEMQDLFDRGEKMLASDPVRLKRWQRARISLDRAVGLRISYLIEEFLRSGQPIEKFPFDIDKCAARVKKELLDSTRAHYDVRNIRVPLKNAQGTAKRLKEGAVKTIDMIYDRMTVTRPVVPTASQLPKELVNADRKELRIFPLASAFMFLESSGKNFKLAAEKDSIFSSVVIREFDPVKNKGVRDGALQIFTYSPTGKMNYSESKLSSAVLDKQGWHWVKFDKVKSSSNTYMAISSSWACQLDISCLAGIEHKAVEHEVWIRVRLKNIDKTKSRLEYDTVIFKAVK